MSRTPPSSQSIYDDLAAQLRQQLVESLRQAGVLQAPALEQAFLRIPREVFVPYFYEQEATRASSPSSTNGAGP
jgi:protein-L-isoaspartate O-methyltransferase